LKVKASTTPRSDAAFASALYHSDDDMQGKAAQYDIGKLRESMELLERELQTLRAAIAAHPDLNAIPLYHLL
jgi:hypothetical protein